MFFLSNRISSRRRPLPTPTDRVGLYGRFLQTADRLLLALSARAKTMQKIPIWIDRHFRWLDWAQASQRLLLSTRSRWSRYPCKPIQRSESFIYYTLHFGNYNEILGID